MLHGQALIEWADLAGHLNDRSDDAIYEMEEEELVEEELDRIVDYQISKDAVDVIFRRIDGSFYQSHRSDGDEFRSELSEPKFCSWY